MTAPSQGTGCGRSEEGGGEWGGEGKQNRTWVWKRRRGVRGGVEEEYIMREGEENEMVGRMEGEEEGEVHVERKTKRRREVERRQFIERERGKRS